MAATLGKVKVAMVNDKKMQKMWPWLSVAVKKWIYNFPEHVQSGSNTLTKNGVDLFFQSTIKRLPGYLCVQMVRFYFKEKGAVNAKILKVNINLLYTFLNQTAILVLWTKLILDLVPFGPVVADCN